MIPRLKADVKVLDDRYLVISGGINIEDENANVIEWIDLLEMKVARRGNSEHNFRSDHARKLLISPRLFADFLDVFVVRRDL